ncbi:saccharopine dehydrogenase family protein [Cryptosporangium arvum]|uniref:saccharopine dehydrogenase family protein n=1 Tax=Cryptosporangium arvum TaxID=80871 RepID=UPI0004B8821A|nr:saccharopine dehydrogenase NADP-binding domain-containing protein [Cryptosporangium arvum]
MARSYDLVLFGATGFTGGLTAEYLGTHAPAGLRWALAGRDLGKLAEVRGRLGRSETELPLLHADAGDAASLRRLAESTGVVASTVGPYVKYGDPLVAACAAAGTDYTDLTGEPRFVDETYLRHHATAARTGARLVHACGFDSIPADLGAWFTVQQLPGGQPLRVESFYRVSGRASAGTVHSLVGAVADAGAARRAARERRSRESSPPAAPLRLLPRTHPVGLWTVPMPTLDPRIVERSATALGYGPGFTYGQYLALPSPVHVAGALAGTAAITAAASWAPTRERLLGRFASGTGPTAEQRLAGWMSVRFSGVAADGTRVLTEVHSDLDPGYASTAIMLAESTLCLALDELPPTAGQVTTAAAMGERLVARLDAAGITFRVRKRWPRSE